MVDEEDVLTMQRLYAEKFGIELSRDEAYRKLEILVTQIDLICEDIRAQLNELNYVENEFNEENENGKPTSRN